MTSDHSCFKCAAAFKLEAGSRIGFRESCDRCGSDLHCCKNCAFYDLKCYNECRETSAERVVDKEKANRCEHFTPAGAGTASQVGSGKESVKRKLDDLFK